jgi:hypothetical protein
MGRRLAGWRGGAGGGASRGRKHDEVDGSRSSERKRELKGCCRAGAQPPSAGGEARKKRGD